MNNLKTFDPLLARKLEHKQNTQYYLWTFTSQLSDFHSVDTIEKARVLWRKAKNSGKWESWELSKGRELVKKGEF